METIKDLSEYYQNVHILDDSVRAVVLLENMEDSFFWDALLQRFRPGRYMFVGHDNSQDESMTMPGGCVECLKYKDYLTQYFFICMDSDMNKMMGNTVLDEHNYICQTYTYSWENHCCESLSLQELCAKKCVSVVDSFDFGVFLKGYSEAVYFPMLMLLFCAKHGDTSFTIKNFSSCIPKQCTREELANNGQGIINKIKNNFSNTIPSSLIKSTDLSPESIYCKTIGIDEQNAYLHTRGHEIYDLLCYVGKLVCKKFGISFERDILKQNTSSQIWEMKRIETDLRSF